MFPSQKWDTQVLPVANAILQWGRDVSIPEIKILPLLSRNCVSLQWGRDVSIPEMGHTGVASSKRHSSMGPGCFHPRNKDSTATIAELRLASMGPGCFHPRNGTHRCCQ